MSLNFPLSPLFLLLSLTSFFFLLTHAADILQPGQTLTDGTTLVSANEIFELGFFSPTGSTNRYIGIWYRNFSTDTQLWVANRENPVTDSSGAMKIAPDGNIIITDNNTNRLLWSTNVSNLSNESSWIVQLLGTGNLVLNVTTTDNNNVVVWQSFDFPTDTYLSGMKVGLDLTTGANQLFTSWRSSGDPAVGNYTMGIAPDRSTQIFIWDGTEPRWRSGRWDGQVFIGIEYMVPLYIYGFKLSNFEQEGKMYFYYSQFNSSHKYALTWDGIVQHLVWKDDTQVWSRLWAAPVTECEHYNRCGNHGRCTDKGTPICSCLPGFVPKSSDQWDSGNWSGGCVRRTPLQCERNVTDVGQSEPDGFWKVEGTKLPDLSDWDSDITNTSSCEGSCLVNCSCKAYAYVTGIGCLTWGVDLVDIHIFSVGGDDLYLRLAASEFDKKPHHIAAFVVVVIVLAVTFFLGCIYLLWKYNRRIKEFIKRKKIQRPAVADGGERREGFGSFSYGSVEMRDARSNGKCQDLPLFSFNSIAAATGNFSFSNMLGEGGFGPVYKGVLPGGQEIAVKRLSRSSGQGVEEFTNEVILIAKLQHRNLVRLLGCCIEEEEKILIYEYMPNRSLDAFLFGSEKKGVLDWKTRYNIIEGIARGLLYLHRDSRLRVIHRDLKVSNILLDEEMIPKISDFGMARIFRSDDKETNTRRVAGTYGYMSPEYAMQGIFSVKSDVYSFGVLLLEIVSGKKNSTFHHHEYSLNLLAYAWKLWKEDNVMEFADPSIADSCSPSEVLRCVSVGLLCVQDRATDRPIMSSVVTMLESESTVYSMPMQPTFGVERSPSDTDSSTFDQRISGADSITRLTGR